MEDIVSTEESAIQTPPSDAPLVLLFSPRKRVRDILGVGLLQCRYRIVKSVTSHVALLKASQFTVDLIIGDITDSNIRDISMVAYAPWYISRILSDNRHDESQSIQELQEQEDRTLSL